MMIVLLCLIVSADSPASAWPQFRGAGGTGLVASAVPEAITPDNATWRTPLPGKGWSSPVIVGDRLWMTTARDDGHDLHAIAVDRATGRVVHDVGLLQPLDVKEIHGQNSYASPTPCVHDGLLLCHFGRYGTAAVDAATAEVIWTDTDHAIDHQGGPGSSPVIAAGNLILTLDGADAAYVLALDPLTGREVWRRNRSAPKRANPITHRAFATPLVTEQDGRTLVISPGADQMQAYDAATGEEVWHVRYVGFSTVPQPARWQDRIIFCTGYFKPSLVAVELGGRGNVTESHTAWTFTGPVPDIPSPVVALNHVWLVSNKGVLTAVNAESGKRTDASRVRGNYAASPLILPAAGEDSARLLIGNQAGELVFVDLTRDGDGSNAKADASVAARIDLGEAIFATPAIADGALYVRTEDAIWCWR